MLVYSYAASDAVPLCYALLFRFCRFASACLFVCALLCCFSALLLLTCFVYAFVKVCASFFYNTLDISWKMVQAAKQYFKDDSFRRAPSPETRGGASKISSEILDGVQRHIKSFRKVPSHWCRKRTKKGYQSSDLNFRRMFNLYQQQCLDSELERDQYASVHTYRKVSCIVSRSLNFSAAQCSPQSSPQFCMPVLLLIKCCHSLLCRYSVRSLIYRFTGHPRMLVENA